MNPGINTRRIVILWSSLVVSLVFALSIASAETVETIIKQLKDPSPEVRIKAAEELCVS